ncbi:MAG TPA: hypothetical protein VGH99_13990 [Pseudonocardia sp.]
MTHSAERVSDPAKQGTVLIDGPAQRAGAVAAALAEAGAQPFLLADLSGSEIDEMRVDTYVQLPEPFRHRDGGAGHGGWSECLLSEVLPARLAAANAVLDRCTGHTRVVLVCPPVPNRLPTRIGTATVTGAHRRCGLATEAADGARLKLGLMQLLGNALQTAHAPRALGIEIRDDACTAATIAAAALPDARSLPATSDIPVGAGRAPVADVEPARSEPAPVTARREPSAADTARPTPLPVASAEPAAVGAHGHAPDRHAEHEEPVRVA